MTTQFRKIWQILVGQEAAEPREEALPTMQHPPQARELDLEIAPNDPLLPYLQSTQGVVEVEKLNLNSPALSALKQAGIMLAIPLVSQGELIGLLNLGPRLSEQEYSADDRRLLSNLATQAAPALRVAQLVRQQQAEARERERIEQELRVARIIQQTLLPKEVPQIAGWQIAAYYKPARHVGGDFYDFIRFPDGMLSLVVGDVTDKGVPAALVMATTRSILRGAAERLVSPAEVLKRANDLLYPDIPPNMFVTCLYAILDPASGRLRYANAGHNLPYRRRTGEVDELRATGMPLGLMPGMTYEEHEVVLAPGESVLFSSDGLVEAHSPQNEMFGFPRLRQLTGQHPGGAALIEFLLSEFAAFTGAEYEPEDDITLVTLEREPARKPTSATDLPARKDADWQSLAEFTLPSERGGERQAMQRVVEAVQDVGLSGPNLEKLKTAVSEATMNAMEHGNQYRADLPVSVRVLAAPQAVKVLITDRGGGNPIPRPEQPDLQAKLAGEQSPRGWGLFLIKNMVDEMNVIQDESSHTVELILYTEGAGHEKPAV